MVLALGMLPECFGNVTDSSPEASAARELKRVAGGGVSSLPSARTRRVSRSSSRVGPCCGMVRGHTILPLQVVAEVVLSSVVAVQTVEHGS